MVKYLDDNLPLLIHTELLTLSSLKHLMIKHSEIPGDRHKIFA